MEPSIQRDADAQGSVPKPSLMALVRSFVRDGNFTFGGGSATIAVLQDELVDRRRWLGHEPFQLSYALSRVTPGTNLLAFCTAAGWLLRGWAGALVSLLAASIPCATLALAATALCEWSHSPGAQAAIRGAMAAAVAVMVMTGVTLIRPHWRSTGWLQVAVFAGGAFVLAQLLAMPPFRVLIVAAAVGWIWPPSR